ncbi:MAG TPA: acyl-CoA dehydrogenase family protein [Vicinamibacteria bacterium]|nr:acyl-CoA dehydrogenase family protein [Vicinamibacteria bacterium]
MSDEPVLDTSGMSAAKRAAFELTESSRESYWEYPTFAGALFMGELPFELVHPYPELPQDRDEKGRAFLAKLEDFLRERTDPDQIDLEGEIPKDVIEGLAAMGAFGIKIPETFGGLGLSQQVYTRAAVLLGSYCGNLSALLSAHQSIGVPQPLLLFGNEEQKRRFLPRVASGEISAFALTERGVGSDPARMETHAVPTEDGKHFILNGEKLWCTNGTLAGLLVVMAKTPSKVVNGREREQITAFVVEADSPGVEVVQRCRFMGLRALYNARIRFTNVKVPRENIIAAEGKGLRVALTTLNTGRVTLPANCVGLGKRALKMATRWAREREQWGVPIGKHAAIANKIARIASTLFAMESVTYLTSALVDRKKTDIRLEAAMAKLFCTEEAWTMADETMQILGGRGYETAQSLKARGETPFIVERALRDARINRIFEGSTEIMHLFIAREAMDPHLRVAGEVMNPKLPLSRRLRAAAKAVAFYAVWYPKQWMPSFSRVKGLVPELQTHVGYVQRTSKKLARAIFHAMVKHGPKLEREQLLLARFVDIGTELFAQAASATRAESLIAQGRNRKEVLALVEHFCQGSRLRIEERFRGVSKNTDRLGYALAQDVLEDAATWLFDGMVQKSLDGDEREPTASAAEAPAPELEKVHS